MSTSRRTGVVIAAIGLLAAAACGSSPAPQRAAVAPPTSAAASPSPSPSKTGPPPVPGTLAWYAAQLPRFEAPPVADGVTLSAHGPVTVYNRVPTKQRVAFVTIDDGWVHNAEALAMIEAADIPVTLFLTTDAIRDDPAYFKKLQDLGAIIENHTISHPHLALMSYEAQRKEICTASDDLAKWYGRRPVLLRAPYGDSNANTQSAAAACGIRGMVFWNEWVDLGAVQWQEPGGVQPGDMLLLHFKDNFAKDFLVALKAIKANGLTPASLEDYLRVPPAPAPAAVQSR